MTKNRPLDNNMAQLTQMTDEVINTSLASANWYAQHKGLRSFFARLVRIFMIFGTLVAALIPLISSLYIEKQINPAWSAVATAIVASLFAFEKFYGHASSWMRFNLAEMQIKHQVELLKLDWLQFKYYQETKSQGELPDWTEKLKAHQVVVQEIELTETKAWNREFESAMKETYKNRKNK